MKILSCISIVLIFTFKSYSQMPVFGDAIPVSINGWSFDAMEPFISPDGNALFFNNLNDGVNTKLFYAARGDDSTFNLIGEVPLVNQTSPPYLDAVASVDTAANFYWVSTRGYPQEMENLHHVTFSNPPSNFGRVLGDIYVYSPGWLIMDASISTYGDKLFYCNAWFNNCLYNMPCRSALAIAEKVNDSTFAKLSNSGTLLAAINDTSNYIVYAPQLSSDELELYYTRALIGVPQTEICVSVRSNTNLPFGPPSVLFSSLNNVPEAPTLTESNDKLYYHKRSGSLYKIFLHYRTGTMEVIDTKRKMAFSIFPNPSNDRLLISIDSNELKNIQLKIFDMAGKEVLSTEIVNCLQPKEVNVSFLSRGTYYVTVIAEGENVYSQKLILSR